MGTVSSRLSNILDLRNNVVVLLFIASSILVVNGNGYGYPPGHDYTSCTDVGGEVIHFHKKLEEQDQISCADPNGGNNYKSLRASSCDRCAKLCHLTGGCHYYTWVPFALLPPGHRNCKLYKNFCCKRTVHDKPYSAHPGRQRRVSGQKFQKCQSGYYG